jgi:hypothetical protein
LAKDLHFNFQFQTSLLSGPLLDQVDERENLSRCGSTEIDNEIAMDIRNHGLSMPLPLEAQLLD